uniref:Uncharacterized protein n=1 Tax=Terrapene triunguis TaxID=2587831 RepID=A0A674I4T1_9SAUR
QVLLPFTLSLFGLVIYPKIVLLFIGKDQATNRSGIVQEDVQPPGKAWGPVFCFILLVHPCVWRT